MRTVEMMVMSGVIRGADFKPPRPATSRGVMKMFRSATPDDTSTSMTGRFLLERIASSFFFRSQKEL
ncbi:MAG TPA: hypothetical protein VJ746_00625 [Nitrospira sp.]|nr:hypothetical protein [Nitrospira sp.]